MTNIDPSLDLYVKAIYGKKASDLVLIDVQGLTSVADIFIICSGSSNRQVSAIAEHIQKELKRHDWDLFLGHRRLAILDLSNIAHQPMSDLSKNIWVELF